MNFDFQRIFLKRAGLLMDEMQPINSGMVAVPVVKRAANGQIGLNFNATRCERMIFACFGNLASKNRIKPNQAELNLIKPNQAKLSQIKPSQTRSNQKIRPNPTKKMDWIFHAGFKTDMEARNS